MYLRAIRCLFFAVYSLVWAGNFRHTGDEEGGEGPIFALSITHYMIYIGLLLSFFLKVMENHQQCVFFEFVCPLAGNFCHTRDGDGGGNQ